MMTSRRNTDEEKERTARRVHIYDVANDILTQRMSYGMVAQSMLLLSYVTLFVSQEKLHMYTVVLEIIVSFLGIFYSVFQASRMIRSARRLSILQNRIIEDDPVFKEYWNAYTPKRRIHQHQVAAALGAAWFGLLIVAILAAFGNSN
ncbi:MAG: hypothetical protein ABSD21_10935 [Rhizomicrobium sp.]|jgi:hypothetical protein